MKIRLSRKSVTSTDILVARGKNLVANATVLAAILSPEVMNQNKKEVARINSFLNITIINEICD